MTDYDNYDDDNDWLSDYIDGDLTQWLHWWGSLIVMNMENASSVSKNDTSWWYLLQKMTFLEK
jgi:hypothetical protein